MRASRDNIHRSDPKIKADQLNENLFKELDLGKEPTDEGSKDILIEKYSRIQKLMVQSFSNPQMYKEIKSSIHNLLIGLIENKTSSYHRDQLKLLLSTLFGKIA